MRDCRSADRGHRADRALQETVFSGGRLNVKLLGGDVTAAPE
jgi:hypothetical protein